MFYERHRVFVELPRFELGMQDPRTCVLPLHHSSVLQCFVLF